MSFKCSQCAALFVTIAERRKHMQKVHANRISRTCCNETFKTLREKVKHDSDMHGDSKQKDVRLVPEVTLEVKQAKLDKATETKCNLKEQCEVLKTAADGKELLLFYSYNHPFSNFHCSPFVLNGSSYRTVEHYYQSEKARYFSDWEKYWLIVGSWSPVNAKRYGSCIQGFCEADWRKVCENIMLDAVRAKVKQNSLIEEELIKSGNKIIAEASPFDKFWGIGQNMHDSNVVEYNKWRGINKLGGILMKLRDEIVSEK